MKKLFYEHLDELLFVSIFAVIVAINACKAYGQTTICPFAKVGVLIINSSLTRVKARAA